MKILTTLIVTSALSVGGYYSWLKPRPAPANIQNPGKPAVAQPAVITAEGAAPVVVAVAATPKPEAPAPAPAPEVKPAAPVTAAATADVKFEEIELITGVEQGTLQAVIRGNGRDEVVCKLRSNSPVPIRVFVPAGQVFENGRNLVVTLRRKFIELKPEQAADFNIPTAALLSANKLGDAPFRLSYQYISRVSHYLRWLNDHPEVCTSAAQTAVLALMENLSVSALAKFAPANGIANKLNTDAFRVETTDLLTALTSIRSAGGRMEAVALANDQQLKLELMIEPLTREGAKRLYGIADEAEWDFWKNELLQGDPSTRHYALFGIARFYPEIALEMLPKWARETKTHPVYRMSAIQAIADTQKPEALAILLQLSADLGPETELGKGAGQAAVFLDQRLSQMVIMPIVAFRGRPEPLEL